MTRDRFNALVEASRAAYPSWFDQVESPASETQLGALERRLAIALPEAFRAFATDHGAGYFGRAIILSAIPDSQWYLPAGGRDGLVQGGFVAFSDDEAGGFHGFACRHGICDGAVLHWYPDEADPPKHVAASFRDWVIEAALPPGRSGDG